MRGRVVALAAVLALVVLVAVAIRGGGELGREPFDPDSVGPLGYQGVVRLARDLGADVDTSTSDLDDLDGLDVVVIVQGDLDADAVAAVSDYVDRGGVVVVLDPTSVYAPVGQAVLRDNGASRSRADCDEPALGGVDRLEAPEMLVFAPSEGHRTCFRSLDSTGFAPEAAGPVALLDAGDGTFVTVDPFLWVNDNLTLADNAALAAALLAPTDGTDVGFLERSRFATGDRSLWSLIDDGIRWGLLQVVIAVGLFLWWRSRRLGRPVPEPQPVELDGADLVVAAGALLQGSARATEAAGRLHDDLRQVIAARLGVATSVPGPEAAALVAARCGLEPELVLRALAPTAITDEPSLVGYTRAVQAVRHAVRPPGGSAPVGVGGANRRRTP